MIHFDEYQKCNLPDKTLSTNEPQSSVKVKEVNDMKIT